MTKRLQIPYSEPTIIEVQVDKETTIDVEIKELTVKDIFGLAEDIFGAFSNQENKSDNNIISQAIEDAIPRVTNLNIVDFQRLSFRAINVIWEQFKEVNPDFFLILSKTGTTAKLTSVITRISGALDLSLSRLLSSNEISQENTEENSQKA